ncbi:outer membrane receptor protein involved in Fe transport [Catalinimonas alkaloidigena]|uniref:TonB-dependent receptor n=1 Tax=Catalinimonas alkaloidigena TaxID=1075417 RepID=UPI002406C841|nr:TonB-dependent receptor plug domain-containing protein [Catalinimonas alkaloidigena]MDF9799950.1 outer membrane receptor protein involved in Fe transport [Catalinimonas alkaloidigena]
MIMIFSSAQCWGQSSVDSTTMYQLQISKDLPLEKVLREQELMIYAANRKLDSLKEVALNVNVLTKERIRQSGVNNIPEALQLLPEFVVKPKANGLYDVEYRGIANSFSSNSNVQVEENLLLLINAVPFNDALTGQVWWEAMPVSIEDIERIELIRSPHGSWFGYGGAVGVINIVTIKSKNTSGTQLQANLQVGQFQSYRYHGSLNIGINDKFAVRVGGHYQASQRFQDQYYVNSVSRYIRSDSLLFFQPDASQTHQYTELAVQSSAFHLSSAYQWNEDKSVSVDLGVQNAQAQSIFMPSDEIFVTHREEQRRWINIHFATPQWSSHIFHQSGDRNYATGYAGWQYHNARTGARLEYHKSLGKYSLLVGTEWINDQFTPSGDTLNKLTLVADAIPLAEDWSQLSGSLYFQQTATFAKNRLHLSSSQRVYQSLQNLDYPLGFHFATEWFLKKNTALQASASQVYKTTQQLYRDTIHGVGPAAIKMLSYAFGVRQHWTNRGMIGISGFYQKMGEPPYLENMPAVGSTFEGNYQINRWTVLGQVTRLIEKEEAFPNYPLWSGSLSGNFTTFFDRLNINAGLYYYSEHYVLDSAAYLVSPQWFVNTKVNYKIWDQYSVYVNIRNLTNRQEVVIPFADQHNRLITIGLNMVL